MKHGSHYYNTNKQIKMIHRLATTLALTLFAAEVNSVSINDNQLAQIEADEPCEYENDIDIDITGDAGDDAEIVQEESQEDGNNLVDIDIDIDYDASEDA